MLRPSFYIFISLISSICHGYTLHGSLKSPTTVSSSSILSPDHYDNESPNDGSFAVADFHFERDYYQVSLRLEDWREQSSDECLFNVTTRWPVVKVGATSLRHLIGSRKVVFTWYDEVYESGLNHRRRPQIIAMDFEDCRPSDLGLQNLLRDPIVLPVTTGGFEVYLEDPVHCKRPHERCVIYYNANFLTFYDPKPFDVRLDWSTLQIENLHNGDMMARGFDDSNTYRVMQFGYLVDTKTIMAWENADPQIAVAASTWMLCWVENPSVNTAVNCSQFNHRGQISYSKIVEFDVPVTPLAVRFLSNNQFILLTGPTSCWNDKSCWELTWTIVSDNSTSSVEKFDCTGDRKSLVVADGLGGKDGSEHYWYTCKNEDRYVYNEKHIEQ